jgi:hypothetical protein
MMLHKWLLSFALLGMISCGNEDATDNPNLGGTADNFAGNNPTPGTGEKTEAPTETKSNKCTDEFVATYNSVVKPPEGLNGMIKEADKPAVKSRCRKFFKQNKDATFTCQTEVQKPGSTTPTMETLSVTTAKAACDQVRVKRTNSEKKKKRTER